MENRQIIIAMKGHPGSGKSTLANSIASFLKCPIIDKDHFRDSTKPIQEILINSSSSSSSSSSSATKLLNDVSYQAMWRVISAQLAVGLDNIVVDSPLSRKAHLDCLVNLAAGANNARVVVVVVECRAEDEAEWRRRVEARGGGSAWHKPGSWKEIEKLLDDYQGCWDYDVGEVPKIVVDTTTKGRMEELVSNVLEFVESKRYC